MNLHRFSKRIHPEWLRSCAGIPLGYFALQRLTKEIKFACWRGLDIRVVERSSICRLKVTVKALVIRSIRG